MVLGQNYIDKKSCTSLYVGIHVTSYCDLRSIKRYSSAQHKDVSFWL